MKRSRNGGVLAAVIIFALMASVLVFSSVRQNAEVRAHFTALFQAIQQDKEDVVQEHYNMQTLDRDYVGMLLHYDLLGWEFGRIGGQPWPMDQEDIYVDMRATLYYDLPDTVVKAKGYKTIVHDRFGRCAVMPVLLRFHYNTKLHFWDLLPPDAKSRVNWLAPTDSAEEFMKSFEGAQKDGATPPEDAE